jgi:hypothetical protein
MQQKQRILLIQLYSNGDCLYATTIAKQVKQDNEHCVLQWMILAPYAGILKNNPWVDEIIPMEKLAGETGDETYARAIKIAAERIKEGKIDTYYFTQIIADNFSNYDGCIRRSLFRGYDKPITVDKTPVLVLDDEEKAAAARFASLHNLASYRQIILFETSPLSGQAALSEADICQIAIAAGKLPGTCIILSSYKSFGINAPHVLDGSVLSIRETVAVTHYCTLLLGCSSGITWGSLSTAGKQLPMIQLLDANAYFFNPPSIDFKFAGIAETAVIELYRYTVDSITNILDTTGTDGFATAKLQYNHVTRNSFALHRGIVHYFLKKRKFRLLKKFLSINLQQHGYDSKMMKKIVQGFVFFPLQLIKDKMKA